jgi:circadian clock protein KaiB
MTDAHARLRLRLYVAGEAPNSVAAVTNLRSALASYKGDPANVEIIDVLQDPECGLRDGIFVTPMLVKVEPAPERRLLGTLRDRSLLFLALGIDEVHDE